MKEALRSSKTRVLTRATWRNISEDAILHSDRRKNLKFYTFAFTLSLNSIFQQGLVALLLILHMAGMLESATLMGAELHIIALMALNWLGGLIGTVRLMDHGAPKSYLPACVSCILNFFQSTEQFYTVIVWV
jgi:hypothetical protein